MKVSMSKYLTEHKDDLKQLVKLLSSKYSYVSVLGTDVEGKTYSVQKTGTGIDTSMWNERGFVVRVHNGINYSEYSFNEISQADVQDLASKISCIVEEDINLIKSSSILLNSYPVIAEESIEGSFLGEVEILPEEMSDSEKLRKMESIKEKAFKKCNLLVDFKIRYETTKVSKIFLSNNKDLEQAYIWSQAYLVPIVRREKVTKVAYKSFSGLKGVEIINEMEDNYEGILDTAIKLLEAKPVVPGEYDIICTPDIAGLIAHEAFGHGVEMDMFVKGRAKAVEYLNKPVASELVTMHDGAKSVYNVSSYLFDDEGTLGTDTVIIDKGILKTGISDILSALKLGTQPTGNGKRESFERKAYARMTNTFFGSGNSTLDEMIASIEHGYLLDGTMSGMEDPKNWGIQCMILIGKEIKNGKFTGNIISPVIMTGYVPDVLKSITMVSNEVELSGAGACGKGYKEFVKVSDGGPYIKTKARLG